MQTWIFCGEDRVVRLCGTCIEGFGVRAELAAMQDAMLFVNLHSNTSSTDTEM